MVPVPDVLHIGQPFGLVMFGTRIYPESCGELPNPELKKKG